MRPTRCASRRLSARPADEPGDRGATCKCACRTTARCCRCRKAWRSASLTVGVRASALRPARPGAMAWRGGGTGRDFGL